MIAKFSLWLQQLFCKHDVHAQEEQVETAYVNSKGQTVYTTRITYHDVSCSKCGLFVRKKK